MNIRDLGLIILLITWLDTIIYSIYLTLNNNIPVTSIENINNIGRNPYLFILNVILFSLSIYIVLKNSPKNEARILKKIFWVYPITTLLITLIYLVIIAGAHALDIFTKALFIPMYIFITLFTTFLVDLSIKPIQISDYTKKYMLILTLAVELIIYIILRILFGASPLLGGTFLLITVVTLALYATGKIKLS